MHVFFRFSVFLLILLLPVKCFGQEFFDYTLDKHLLFANEIFTANLAYDVGSIALKRFVIKPILKHEINSESNVFTAITGLQICCNALGNWVFADERWTNMPILDEIIKLRFTNSAETEIKKEILYFEILDTKTGLIYNTPERPFWIGNPIYSNYVKKINTWVTERKNASNQIELNADAYKMLKLTNDQAP